MHDLLGHEFANIYVLSSINKSVFFEYFYQNLIFSNEACKFSSL